MKFSIGDKIILKQTGEEGHVTAYINKEMFEVEVNGTTFPVYSDDIDHPYLKWFTEKKKIPVIKSMPEQLPVEKEKFRKPKLASGVHLSFLPQYKADVFEDEVEILKIYLLNELPQTIYFHYKVTDKNQHVVFVHEGKLHGFGHVYMHSMAFDVMNEQPRFHWELTDADNPTDETEGGILKIKPQKLFEHISDMLKKNEPSFSYLLAEDFKPKAKEEKKEEIIPPTIKPVQSVTNWKDALPKLEIDLHIEQLTDNTKGMSSTDKLDIQLSALKSYLHTVIANRQERTIIIHGLGKGVLRDEVHKILKQTPEVSRYNNDWHGRYGFGATEVWFEYQ